ncbi:MAG: SUMF1/EgtB/PvdO family nonheme iron enzyme [Pseudomonadota bacterium]
MVERDFDFKAARRRLQEADKDERFDRLVARIGLDPAVDLRLADWSNVDFSGCDLRGFDFSGARLWGCDFTGARIEGAVFDKAELGSVIPETAVAQLRNAADWEKYKATWRPSSQPLSDRWLRPHIIFQDAPFAPEMAVIPAGRFLMGSPPDEPGRRDDEGPQHEVTHARPFALGGFAVTLDEYDTYCAATGSKRPDDRVWGRGWTPATRVSWEDAQAYCRWLSETAGAAYRLPSEAEWEYACRAGTTTCFWWGDEITSDKVNGGGGFEKKTAPVGAFAPTPWRLRKTFGVVWEWCQDCWNDSYSGAPNDGSACMTGVVSHAVIRRAPSLKSRERTNSATRHWKARDLWVSNVGFRVARTLGE